MSDPGLAPDPPDALVERLRRYQEILLDFARIAAGGADLGLLLRLACAQAGRGVGVGHAKVLRYRAGEGDLLVEAGIGWRPGFVGHARFGADVASPPGRALRTGRAVAVADLRGEAEFRHSRLLREHGIVSLLNVPVAAGGAAWGVLEVDSERPRRFGAEDETFLATMAAMLGAAVRRLADARAAADEAARAAAGHGTMLRELLHRDKNDFQLIVSLLAMQRRAQRDPEARRGLGHVMDRVAAIGTAHDLLAAGEGSIDLGGYLRALCGGLDRRREGVRVEADADAAVVAHERAVPLGLIVNELATNALKHAFPGDRGGVVRVTFRADHGTGEGRLRVADDGVGLGAPREGSSGLGLVRSLARQVGGRVVEGAGDGPGGAGAGFGIEFLLVR